MKISNTWIDLGTGYRAITINGTTKRNSHYIWYLNTGYWPDWKNKREVINHINENKLDDRFENLQLMSHSEHSKLHSRGEKNPCFGRTSEKNPQHFKTGSSSHRWIEGDQSYGTHWMRIKRAKQRISQGRGNDEDYLITGQEEDVDIDE